jgi:hypothetical protein
VAANILNKQSQTADKGWSYSLEVGRGAATPHRKKFLLLRNVSKRLEPDSLARPKQWKKDMRFGTWNIRSLCRVGTIKSVVGELEKYKLDLVGVQEVRWEGEGYQAAENCDRSRWCDIIVLNVHAPTQDIYTHTYTHIRRTRTGI